MDTLGPNPSLEAVEDERDFYQILLDTLDFDALDYAEQKRNNERIIREMDAYISSKRSLPQSSPLTPSRNAAAHDSDLNLNLPSRERPALPRWGTDITSSPSSHRLAAPPQTGISERKRPRENSLRASDSTTNSYKSRRTSASGSVSGSSVSTPVSVDSLDEASAAYEKEASRQRLLAQQRQREERFRQQRQDEELARKLAEEMADPTSSFSSAGPSSQTYFGNDGRIQRPQPPPPQIVQDNLPRRMPDNVDLTDHTSYIPAQTAGHASAHRPAAWRSLPAATYRSDRKPPGGPGDNLSLSYNNGQTANPRPTGAQARQPDLSSQIPQRHSWMQPPQTTQNELAGMRPPSKPSSDSDLELISPEQFRAASLSRPQQSPYKIPGGYPSSLNAGVVNMGHPSLPAMSSIRPGQNMYGGYSSAGPSDWMSSLISAGQNFAHGVSKAWNPMYIDSDDSDDETYRRNMIRERGLDYLYSDPTRNKEELDNLLKNIRPDEDLPDELRQDTPRAMSLPLMAHQKLGLTWLKQQEEGSNKGCILADDMGLGKTIQALALMLVRPSEDPAVKTTLIIAPVALLKQWQDEIDDKVKPGHKLRTIIFHGPSKATYAKLASYDVVITTLGKVGAEMKRKEDFELRQKNHPSLVRTKKDDLSLLGDRCKWYRVIVDEAQSIKNKLTRGAQAACRLQAKHRLCMTGTPMMNNVGELYSLIHFLRIPPYNVYENFQRDIGKPIASPHGSERERERGMRALQAVLKAILLRRTKQSTIKDDNGVERPILTLPPRSTEIVHAVFDEEQKEFYEALEKTTAMKANRFLKSGHIGRNYANVLVLLLRLRQACDHPHLIKDLDTPEGTELNVHDMEKVAKMLPETAVSMIKEANGAFECPVCYDGVENPTIFFPCGHDVCSECFAKITDPSQAIAAGEEHFTAKCPECRAPIKPDTILTYNIFKKVHLHDDYVADMVDMPGNEDGNDSETESDDDSDSSQGDLRDFIVDDDDEEEEEEAEETGDDEAKQDVKDEEADDDDDDAFVPNKHKAKIGKKPKSAGNGKGKGKGKAIKPAKKKKTLADLKKEGQRNAKAKRKYLKRLEKNYEPSAKIEKTMEILGNLEETSPEEKTIIFSQFTSFLDLLEVPIMRAGLGYKRYDGSMSAKERENSLREFKDNPRIKVMLVSLRAGNSGLNLTRASQVIILDPFWNPFIEDQAIDRAHRIGQQREVKVHRILCEKTVEDRIVALQEKKRQLINEALDEKAAQSLSRLGVEELRYLFGLGGQPN